MYMGRDHRPSTNKLTNFLTHLAEYEKDSNRLILGGILKVGTDYTLEKKNGYGFIYQIAFTQTIKCALLSLALILSYNCIFVGKQIIMFVSTQ
jgi:hypothetical protein